MNTSKQELRDNNEKMMDLVANSKSMEAHEQHMLMSLIEKNNKILTDLGAVTPKQVVVADSEEIPESNSIFARYRRCKSLEELYQWRKTLKTPTTPEEVGELFLPFAGWNLISNHSAHIDTVKKICQELLDQGRHYSVSRYSDELNVIELVTKCYVPYMNSNMVKGLRNFSSKRLGNVNTRVCNIYELARHLSLGDVVIRINPIMLDTVFQYMDDGRSRTVSAWLDRILTLNMLMVFGETNPENFPKWD